jgi:hypothetical protein
LETKSSSVDISVSSINTFTSSNSNTSLNSKTGSYATTGSNSFYGTQVFSGSVYIANDLIVQGSSSIQYISASSVSIGTNIVQLNTATPSVRFAGLSVQDSGSSAGVTGSILWDSLCNRWIYSNPSTIGYSGGMLMSGPRTSTLGTELPLTCNYIAKSGGGDHLYDSCIIDDGTTTCIKNNLVVGVGNFTNCLTFGDWTTAANVLSSNKPNEQGAYIRAAVSTAANPTYTFEDDRDTGMYRDSANSLGFTTGGSNRLIITSGGNVGVGISDPNTVLDINSTGGGVGGWTGIRLKAGTSSVQSLSMGQVTAGNGAWIGMSQYNQAGYWKTEGTAAAVMVFNSDGSFIISTNCGLTANTDYNLCQRLKIDAVGISCFSNTICAPNYAGGTSYTIDFVVVAGGGGGGGSEMSNGYGGGGGAGGGGGYLASSISVNCGSTYPIVVGTGGIGGCSRLAPDGGGLPGAPGTFSSAFGFAAAGGGSGGGDEGGQACNNVACTNGGSGGGQGGDGGGTLGIAVIGQGFNAGPAVSRTGGGGGGAGSQPGGASGGQGKQWYDGNYYSGGGGGGGGGNNQTLNAGGAGGGGQGSRSFPGGGTPGEAGGHACAGAACSGGGGGGAGAGYLQGGQAGGSGVVIIRYFGGTRASGGTITASGGYTYHKFGAAGTFTA